MAEFFLDIIENPEIYRVASSPSSMDIIRA
jgi:hypothetical protein